MPVLVSNQMRCALSDTEQLESQTCLPGLCKKKKETSVEFGASSFYVEPRRISWWERKWIHSIHSSSAPPATASYHCARSRKPLANSGRPATVTSTWFSSESDSLSALRPPLTSSSLLLPGVRRSPLRPLACLLFSSFVNSSK